jgi:hypothetical protein
VFNTVGTTTTGPGSLVVGFRATGT